MELKIIEEKQNPVFKRKEIQATIEAEITPSKIEVTKLVSEKFSAELETIKIDFIKGNFGTKVSKVSAKVYDSKEAKESIEGKSKEEDKLAEPEQAPAPAETPVSTEAPVAAPEGVPSDEGKEPKAETPTETPTEIKPEENKE